MKTLMHCLLALVALLLVSAQLRTWDRWGYYGPYHVKARHLEEHSENYDTVVFGSSRMYRGLNPIAMDQELKRLGSNWSTFNASYPGSLGHEINYVTNDFLAYMPRRAKRFLIGVTGWDPRIKEANQMSDRMLLWHSWRETWSVRDSLDLHLPEKEQLTSAQKAEVAWDHLEHMARWTFRTGRGQAIISELVAPPTINTNRHVHLRRNGYVPYDLTVKSLKKRHQMFQANSAHFLRSSRSLAESPPSHRRYELNWPAMAEQVARIRAHGVELIYVIAPAAAPRLSVAATERLRTLATVLDYSDARRYPKLYAPEERFDATHLNDVGAERFSKQLARDLHALEAAKLRAAKLPTPTNTRGN